MIETLARQRTATPTSLAAELPITRQALSKHLRALDEAGLVTSSRAGRETRYELTPQALSDAAEWLVRVGAEWDERLGGLERTLRERHRR